jgi:hypothetical protein
MSAAMVFLIYTSGAGSAWKLKVSAPHRRKLRSALGFPENK